MIVWINGAFGAGKTTLAAELRRRMPDALGYDPEYVGYLLRKWVPGDGDFQDLPVWRTLAAQFAIGMADQFGKPLITPMTLVDAGYRREIFERIAAAGVPLLHVFLDVPADEVRRRIGTGADEFGAEATAFRLGNVDRCVAARDTLEPDALVLRGDRHTPAELADRVEAAMTGRRAPSAGC